MRVAPTGASTSALPTVGCILPTLSIRTTVRRSPWTRMSGLVGRHVPGHLQRGNPAAAFRAVVSHQRVAVNAFNDPSLSSHLGGFRCAR